VVSKRIRGKDNFAFLYLRIKQFKHRVRVTRVRLKSTVGDEGEDLQLTTSYELFRVKIEQHIVNLWWSS